MCHLLSADTILIAIDNDVIDWKLDAIQKSQA